MKCKCSLEKKLDCRPCDVVDESRWCQVAYHTLLAQVTHTMLPSHAPCLVHALLASKRRATLVTLGQRWHIRLGPNDPNKCSSFYWKQRL